MNGHLTRNLVNIALYCLSIAYSTLQQRIKVLERRVKIPFIQQLRNVIIFFQQTIIVKPPPEALLGPRYSTRRTLQAMEEGTLFYKLGQEAAYKQYINQFTNNPHALSKVQANEERVKRTHMSHKFSLTDVSTFRWMGMYYYLSIFSHF